LTEIKSPGARSGDAGFTRHGASGMISFIGNHYIILALTAAALFMGVVGFVSIEDAFGHRR